MSKTLSVSEYFSYFKDKRLINIFIFGMSSGFPWVLIGSVMSAWLKDEGLSRSMIGLFGIVFGAYSINFMWSPLIDRTKLPLLYKWFGQRRSWILFCQSFMFIGTLLLAGLDLKANLAIAAGFLCGEAARSGQSRRIPVWGVWETRSEPPGGCGGGWETGMSRRGDRS